MNVQNRRARSLRSWRDYNAGVLFWRRSRHAHATKPRGKIAIGLVLILLAAPPPILTAGLPHTAFTSPLLHSPRLSRQLSSLARADGHLGAYCREPSPLGIRP